MEDQLPPSSYVPPLDPFGVPVPKPPAETEPQVEGSPVAAKHDGAAPLDVPSGRSEEQRPGGNDATQPSQGIESHGAVPEVVSAQSLSHEGVVEPVRVHGSIEEEVRIGDGKEDASIH